MNSPQSPAHVHSPQTSSPLRPTSANTSITSANQVIPLKISKRESLLKDQSNANTAGLARRQSASYKHARNHALVSNSPFKLAGGDAAKQQRQLGPASGGRPSRIPAPRRASGEKKGKKFTEPQRQTSSEHNLGPKRRQSKGLQGLVKAEPVSKSPFKRIVSPDPDPDPATSGQQDVVEQESEPVPAPRALPVAPSPPSTVIPQTPPRQARVAALTSPTSPSPRSSLVSKRLHGPRSPSGSPGSIEGSGKRQRRKTVTFDERCDVLEFDRDDTASEGVFDTEDEDDHSYDTPTPEPLSPVLSDTLVGLVDSILVEELGPSTPTFNTSSPNRSTDNAEGFGHHLAAYEGGESSFLGSGHPTPEHSPFDPNPSSMASTPVSFHSLEFNVEDAVQFSLPEGEMIVNTNVLEQDMFELPPSPSPSAAVDRHSDDESIPNFHLSDLPDPPSHDHTYSDDPFIEQPPIRDVPVMDFTLSELSQDDSTASPNFITELPGIPESGPILFDTRLTIELPAAPLSLADSDSSRTPRISRENVKRRLLQQRKLGEELGDSFNGSDLSNGRSPASPDDSSPISRPPSFKPVPRIGKSLPTPPSGSPINLSNLSPSYNSLGPDTQSQPLPSPDPPRPFVQTQVSSHDIPARSTFDFNRPGLDLGDVRSALDRLMIGVERGFATSITSAGDGETTEDGDSVKGFFGAETTWTTAVRAKTVIFPPTDASVTETETEEEGPLTPAQNQEVFGHFGESQPQKRLPEISPSPRSVTPTGPDVIRAHEAAIIAKRRELRKMEGRPNKRRSLSTGDAHDMRVEQEAAQRLEIGGLADLLEVPNQTNEVGLSDSINRELNKIQIGNERRYRLREHENTIYASGDDKVSHVGRVGDVDSGKAWRTVRRPSDMNEYSRQIKEYRSQEKPGKSNGKVFVKVLGIKGITIPLPNAATFFSCTLNNGIHFVTTPETRLYRDSRIDQEFELIEHGKLEFTLTLKVRKDPHVLAQMEAARPAPPPPPSKGGMLSFFNSPRKAAKSRKEHVLPTADAFGKYIKQDGSLACAFVSFKDIASRCDTRLFETSYPLIGQWSEGPAVVKTTTKPIGEIVLQVFRLPPLPGIPQDQLPQSLEECHRGLRHIAWHKVTYHQGVLTQNGGDCSVWRRRHLRLIGAKLVAFNDVTKKMTTSIDLRKATAVEDNQESTDGVPSPGTGYLARSRSEDHGVYVERSFRIIFGSEEISFFADSDAEKVSWLQVLRALVGRIPPNPLWAELIWQRQEANGPNPSEPSTGDAPGKRTR